VRQTSEAVDRCLLSRSRGPDGSATPDTEQVSMKGNGSDRGPWNFLVGRHSGDMETYDRYYHGYCQPAA
jgi:hypothetical protein